MLKEKEAIRKKLLKLHDDNKEILGYGEKLKEIKGEHDTVERETKIAKENLDMLAGKILKRTGIYNGHGIRRGRRMSSLWQYTSS